MVHQPCCAVVAVLGGCGCSATAVRNDWALREPLEVVKLSVDAIAAFMGQFGKRVATRYCVGDARPPRRAPRVGVLHSISAFSVASCT